MSVVESTPESYWKVPCSLCFILIYKLKLCSIFSLGEAFEVALCSVLSILYLKFFITVLLKFSPFYSIDFEYPLHQWAND